MDNNIEEAHIKKLISLAGSLRNAMEFRLCNGYPRARFTTSRRRRVFYRTEVHIHFNLIFSSIIS